MKKKNYLKKKIDVIFIVFREELQGHKDIDHLLPFLYLLKIRNTPEFNLKLIILENKSNYNKNLDPRIQLLFNIKNLDIEYLFENPFLSKLKYLVDINNIFFSNILRKLFYRFYFKFLNLKLKRLNLKKKIGSEFLKSNKPLIVTLHSNLKAERLINRIKQINVKVKWMIIPHGTDMMWNKMLIERHLDKIDRSISRRIPKIVDFYLYTSKHEQVVKNSKLLNKKNLFLIGSPRYCYEWIKLKSKLGLDGIKIRSKNNFKVKILFLIPKKNINIFWSEVLRTIDFVSSYKNIELIILNYDNSFPIFPNYIIKRFNIKFFSISKEYSTSKLIDWSDIVLHAGASVIFEVFMKEKIAVLPRYLTCNTLYSEKYNAGFNLNNRDELRDLCNQAVSSLTLLKKKYKKQCYNSNKQFINDFVNGGLNSVPKNLNRIMAKISDNF
jgi:hypothetical protein